MSQATKNKYSEEALRAEILTDIQSETRFLQSLGDKAPEKLITDLDVLIDVYNEQVTALTHYRADLETFILLEKQEPWNEAWKQKKIDTETILRGRRMTLEAVRNQLKFMLDK